MINTNHDYSKLLVNPIREMFSKVTSTISTTGASEQNLKTMYRPTHLPRQFHYWIEVYVGAKIVEASKAPNIFFHTLLVVYYTTIISRFV